MVAVVVESLRAHRWSPAWSVAVAIGLAAVLSFPGGLEPDALDQLRQAQSHAYNDWHPPVMAVVWSWLLSLTKQRGALLLLHQLLYGVGFSLFVDGCFRSSRPRQAWALASASCFPLFLFFNRLVLKDVAMASALLCAVGIVFWYAVQGRRRPWWATALAGLVLAYGVLVRINAVFVVGPLLLLFFDGTSRWRGVRVLAASLAASVLALPLADVINHKVLGAQRLDVMQQLQIFDLMGIEARTGDGTVWGPHPVAVDDARRCYTPLWWDTFSTWGACASLRPAMGQLRHGNPPEVIAERSQLWKEAILAHPLTYFTHRVSHFNSSIYFAVPPFHIRYKHLPSEHVPGEEGTALRSKIRLDYVKINALVWPATWLAIGLVALVALRRRPASDACANVSRALVISALLYSLAYFVIGIATDVRYHYWSILAICVACLASWDAIRSAFAKPGTIERLSIAALASVVLAGYVTRFLDISLL